MILREAGTRFRDFKIFTTQYNTKNKPHLYDFDYENQSYISKVMPLYVANTNNKYLKKVLNFIEEVFRDLFKQVKRLQRFKNPYISNF